MSGQYRKKPVVVEAYQFDNRISNRPPYWLTSAIARGEVVDHTGEKHPHLIVETLEGKMRVSFMDWIIKGVQGEIYPCKPDIFDATYEVVEEAEALLDDHSEDDRYNYVAPGWPGT